MQKTSLAVQRDLFLIHEDQKSYFMEYQIAHKVVSLV